MLILRHLMVLFHTAVLRDVSFYVSSVRLVSDFEYFFVYLRRGIVRVRALAGSAGRAIEMALMFDLGRVFCSSCSLNAYSLCD